MLSKCANPVCSAKFRYLHEGKLYLIDYHAIFAGRRTSITPQLAINSNKFEYFWLCSSCYQDMALHIDDGGRVKLFHKQNESVIFLNNPGVRDYAMVSVDTIV
jgi:hypothetical protein